MLFVVTRKISLSQKIDKAQQLHKCAHTNTHARTTYKSVQCSKQQQNYKKLYIKTFTKKKIILNKSTLPS